ncbi:MAG TPA: ATP-binding cassette domain-containing protein [Candidatus Methylacidiphilales bacterium]|nr:ATP-binding cassette domain-containing protein [Candidatus Methylacidiphilales bacterium]
MLQLEKVSVEIGSGEETQRLLNQVSLTFRRGTFGAVIGPSGCGKSTLLKLIAGLHQPSEGEIYWDGRNLMTEGDIEPSELGYVPQFNIAHETLTVRESLEYMLSLRSRLRGRAVRDERLGNIIKRTGLAHLVDRPSKVLSGGERRRLALALEMTSNPALLLCDEVTSGLDPKSETDITKLMRDISRDGDRLVLNITHSLKHIEQYDTITVLKRGRLVFTGSPDQMLSYFNIETPEAAYDRMEEQDENAWEAQWLQSRFSQAPDIATPEGWDTLWESSSTRFVGEVQDMMAPGHPPRLSEAYATAGAAVNGVPDNSGATISTRRVTLNRRAEPATAALDEGSPLPEGAESPEEAQAVAEQAEQLSNRAQASPLPGALSQFLTLTHRRWLLFMRDKEQIFLQGVLLVLFPCLVALFALDGLTKMKDISATSDTNWLQQIKENSEYAMHTIKVGSLVSGLVMFQVILLTLMGSNNSAREVVSERLILEKEKLSGLRSSSYLASKIFFLFIIVAIQSAVMTLFVKVVCQFPGDLMNQMLLLFLVNAAMTSVCLAISSWARTTEQASLLSVYLVGFQLPLSGSVLALPDGFRLVTQQFIASYWSWSGMLVTMKETRYWDAVKEVTSTPLGNATIAISVFMLTAHVVFSLVVAFMGCNRNQWAD